VGCEEVLEELHRGATRAGTAFVRTDVRLAERHGQCSGEPGTNAGGDRRNTGEGEQAGVEERRSR
jgi:hypothetical protein